jgi:hypothetical protein
LNLTKGAGRAKRNSMQRMPACEKEAREECLESMAKVPELQEKHTRRASGRAQARAESTAKVLESTTRMPKSTKGVESVYGIIPFPTLALLRSSSLL